MSEYRQHRCCMCPNKEQKTEVCPGIKGTPHPDETPCDFVNEYIDSREWKYRVMSGLGDVGFKGRYQKPGKTGWHCMRNLEWRENFDQAQSELNAMAELKGWKTIG